MAQQKPAGLPGNYPNKPIRVIVGASPGGGSDIITRLVTSKLSERWASSFVVENLASGVGAILAINTVAKAPPDGYTLLVAANGSIVDAALVNKVSFDIPSVFAPVAQFTAQPYVLTISNSLPVNSVKELIAYIKARPEQLNYGSSGIGSAAHIGMEQLKYIEGLEITHIPYKGAAPVITDMIGGRIQVFFGSVLAVIPNAKSGKLRALAIGSLKRSELLPDIPAIAEDVPGFQMVGWYGLMTRAGTAMPVINALNRDIVQILRTPEMKHRLAADGAEAPQATPAQFGETIKSEIQRVEKLMKETKLKLEQ